MYLYSLPTHNFLLTGWRYSSYARWRRIFRLEVKGTERQVRDWHKLGAFWRIVCLESDWSHTRPWKILVLIAFERYQLRLDRLKRKG